jgi:hypothetical protein
MNAKMDVVVEEIVLIKPVIVNSLSIYIYRYIY